MYQINAEALIKDLETLDRDIRDRLAPLRGRTLWVVHPSWGYFAEAYGLVQRAVEHEGKEPGPKRLVHLIAEMKRQGARVIFTDPQFSDKTARLIAREAGADVKPLDTLAHNYLENLRNAMDVIAGSI
jgi:zinc transport system substrate-binding protein